MSPGLRLATAWLTRVVAWTIIFGGAVQFLIALFLVAIGGPAWVAVGFAGVGLAAMVTSWVVDGWALAYILKASASREARQRGFDVVAKRDAGRG